MDNVILAAYIENTHFTTDTQLNEMIDFKENHRYDFYNCTFDNITIPNDVMFGEFEKCRFNNCIFYDFNGTEMNFKESVLSDCDITRCSFKDSDFTEAKIHFTPISNTDFTNANFESSTIHNLGLSRDNLSGVKFHNATLNDVIITDAIVNKPVEGLYIENITMDGATYQEIKVNRNRILSELKLEPISFEQIAKQSRDSLEPLPETGQNHTEINGKQIRFKILPADPVTEYLYNVQVHFKYEFTDEFFYSGIGHFCKNLDEVDKYINKIEAEYSERGYAFSYEGRDEAVQKQHYDKLKTIAEYEQNLNVSPEERIIEMNYSTAHWQPKEGITPDQAEAVYNYIEDTQRIGFDRSNEIRRGVGQSPLTADKYYSNIKNMAYVKRFTFGDENSIDIEAIQSALKEVPTEYVISQMTPEQLNLYADYYEASIDFAGTTTVNLSSAEQNLYNNIISIRKNTSSLERKPDFEIKSFSNSHPANELVDEHKFYKPSISPNEKVLKLQQYTIIGKFNPAPNTYQTWIRSVDDIKTFEDALNDSDYTGWEQNGFDESYSASDAKNALKSGKITVYSSHPIKQGVFVTPSPMKARSYSGDENIYSKEVALDAVAWIDPTQGQYANVEEYAAQMRSELDIKFNGDYWSIVDKSTQKELELPSGDTTFEMLHIVAQEYPEYREFINNNFDKLIDDIARAEQAISDEAIMVEHDRLSAAISQGGFGEDMADSAAYQKLQHLENLMSTSDNVLDNNIKPERIILEEYLGRKGLSSPVDDFMIDKLKLPHGQSKYDERKMHENARKSSQEYHSKRNAAIQEYQEKIAAGEIIEPTNVERYIKAAQGHPDNASTQAARRVLAKRGYTQNANGDWVLKESEINQLSKDVIQPKQTKSLSKEEFDKLTSEIKDITKTYQSDSELLTDYFAFKAQFYQYSPTNTMLIHIQNPYATFVASFTKWKQLGYSIKKGQHHIKISRPIEITKFPKTVNGKTVWTDVKFASPEEKAKIANGELEIKKFTKFIPHQVFDISQTNCPIEDYPKFYNMGHPDMEQQQLYECVKEYAKECGFTVSEEDLSSISLHGYYNRADDSIHINSLLEDSERLRTMCHELAHGVLHKTSTQPVEIMEFEAECFSAMLKRKMGFPISEESKRYIKQYFTKSNVLNNGKFDMSKTLDRLSKTFNHISNGIDTTISNMGFSQEKELSHNLAQANNKAVDVNKISENFMQALS